MRETEVFCLTNDSGEPLNPALQATVLAKYSRSPESARDLLASLTVEEADKFQEKWTVGYGHASVAELAVPAVCAERISIVASKFFESWQRPGYSEKSTRYQAFSRESFVTPPGAPATMAQFAGRFYDAYDRLRERMTKRCAMLMGKDPNDPAVLTNSVVKARAFDNLRYLLPAGTGTNVAIVGNFRDLRGMITQGRGHTNSEFRLIGDGIHDAVQKIAPTLVKHTEPDSFEPAVKSLGNLSKKFDFTKPDWYVDIYQPHLLPDPNLAQKSFETIIADRHGMSWSAFCKLMEGRPNHRAVPRVFRGVRISFEVMMDYGAYRDLQRQRRLEIYAEPLTVSYGYVVPDDILGSELEAEYRAAMESVHAYNDENVVHDADLMQYMIPLGYLHRSVFEMDLEQLYYVVELRTPDKGHISYRRVAYEMYRIGKARFPQMMEWCRAIQPDAIGVHT
jgi:thymidylate synthase ThyX